jgi:hypothetical protein
MPQRQTCRACACSPIPVPASKTYKANHAGALPRPLLLALESPRAPRCYAQQVEEAFAAKLVLISPEGPKSDDADSDVGDLSMAASTRTVQIDKSLLVLPEPRRIRDRDHIRHVMKQPCLVCGRRPSDPHHPRFAQWRALGRKVSDEFTLPLCRTHHREIHRCGNEESWWQRSGMDPLAAARTLWLETHPLPAEGGTTNYWAAVDSG